MGSSNIDLKTTTSPEPLAPSPKGLGHRLSVIDLIPDSTPSDFFSEVRSGLSASPKHLPPRFFYDAAGSLLFNAITELPEYYITRAELEILENYAEKLTAEFPDGTTIIELGSGSASKTRILIEVFHDIHSSLRYVPLDISKGMLEQTSLRLLAEYPKLEIVAIAGEYAYALAHLPEDFSGPKLFLWLGSNISNLDRSPALALLAAIRRRIDHPDRLLVGFDLQKDRQTLEAAYNDPGGVTAQFNLNLLARMNRELGGQFDLTKFHHKAFYNEKAMRIEMHLVSNAAQEIFVEALGVRFCFGEGETIHTENSYKYSPKDIEDLIWAAGFRLNQQWFDTERRFTNTLLVPR